MRRKLVVVAVAMVALSVAAAAADAPPLEVFAGFSWGHVDTMKQPGVKANYPGWNAAVQVNPWKAIGLKADVSGYYGTPISGGPSGSVLTFMGGPQVSFRGEHAKPFAHALFGMSRISVDTFGSDTALAMAFGGGLDVKVNNTLGIRIGQFDWLYTRHDATPLGLANHQNNFRFSAGVTLAFGGD